MISKKQYPEQLFSKQIEMAQNSFQMEDPNKAIAPVSTEKAVALPGPDEVVKDENTENSKNTVKNTRTPVIKNSKTPKNKNARTQENKKSRVQESKKSRDIDNKKSKVVTDTSGQTRRPANITIADDVKVAMDVLAAQRRVRVWTLYDQACREFLAKEEKKSRDHENKS